MQAYRLEILDEKVITVLQGLVELSHIKLAPITDVAHKISEEETLITDELKQKHPLLQHYGALGRKKTVEEIDAEVEKQREGWL